MRRRTAASLAKAALGVGFVALGGGVLAAHTAPATGYEVSVYRGTPAAFWAGFALAMTVSAAVALLTRESVLRRLALGLGGGAMAAFVALPVVRGYHLFASADTMTHLGWVRDLATGATDAGALIYPGIHVLAVAIHEVCGFSLERSLMLVTVLFSLLFFAFVALAVGRLVGGETGTTVGALSAFLLLPVNVIVVKLSAHPISQTVLYTALVFALLFWYLADEAPSGRLPGSRVGALLCLVLLALVLYHPMAAAFVLVVFATISIAQFAYRRLSSGAAIDSVRPVYVPTLFLAGWLGVWMFVVHPGLTDQAMRIGERIALFAGGDTPPAQVVTERQASIRDVGATLPGMFVKLFLVSAVYALLGAVVMGATLLGRFPTERRETSTTIALVAAGLVVGFPFALVQFIGDISSLFFRYVGLMMVLGTVFGAVAIASFLRGDRRSDALGSGRAATDGSGRTQTDGGRDDRGGGRRGRIRTGARVALVVVFAGMLLFTAAFNYPSTSLYLPSGHVTEAEFDGHDAVFDLQDPDYYLASIGYGPDRYYDAIEGTTATTDARGGRLPSPEYDHDLVGYVTNASLGDGRYLLLSDRKERRRVVAYRGLRYDRSDFRTVESAVGVDRVFDNGAARLYLHADATA